MIKDEKKTKSQLIEELSELRQKAAELDSYKERRSKFIPMFRTLMDSSPVPVVVSDKDQKILFLSRKFEENFGYDREEVATLDDWWHVSCPNKTNGGEIIKSWHHNIKQFVKHGTEIEPIETGVICKDGSKRYVEFRFINIGEQYMMFCHDLTDAKRTEDELAQANERLKVWVCELEMQNNRMNMLRRMGEALQTCRSVEDAPPVIGKFAPQLFPRTNGSLYIFDESCGKMKAVVKWGNYSDEEILFVPENCEALKEGKSIEEKEQSSESRAKTLDSCICSRNNWFGSRKALCLPMKAAGQAQGILHLGFHDTDEAYEKGMKELGLVVADHLALSLANLKLQETLRAQAFHDPLTGLFNRRYMEESLEREFHRAGRRNHPLSMVMADIDHFKLFNDTYGHDAGDVLLKHMGEILQKNVRKEDIVCRFGGEEFVLIMPDMALDVAIHRAEHLREVLKAFHFNYQGLSLGAVTISLGVAAFPGHGSDAQTVLRKADDALYKAKNNGRNRVEVAIVR